MERDRTARTGTADDAYREAFAQFLAGTDEKTNAHAYLRAVVDTMPTRRVFLDVGAADGTTTRHLAPYFERTVCIEPSAPMRRVLARTCPQAEVVAQPVADARVETPADLALVSHVLYYIPREQWTATITRILDWVAPGGVVLVWLQDPDNACMRMVRHLTGCRFDVRDLAGELAALPPGLVERTRLDTVPASYHGRNLEETISVAGFHLSLPGAPPPSREEVETYVRQHFDNGDGTYTIHHDQHVLRIDRPVP
ncbi:MULTISPECIES: class I SAM-dependent methyltransferase [unclassified Streptomyces]|uniref:class I SAM-dependent methyltransferase n=1 Tax=unclassified Streptomyces TaxID=2593676 RepID=UPI0036B7D4C7